MHRISRMPAAGATRTAMALWLDLRRREETLAVRVALGPNAARFTDDDLRTLYLAS